MRYRHGLLQGFAEGFKTANRSVFIDTYSNYHFVKNFGEEKEAENILKPELLAVCHLGNQVKREVQNRLSEFESLEVRVRGDVFGLDQVHQRCNLGVDSSFELEVFLAGISGGGLRLQPIMRMRISRTEHIIEVRVQAH